MKDRIPFFVVVIIILIVQTSWMAKELVADSTPFPPATQFPDSLTTGVQSGIRLTVAKGDTIRTDDTIIEAKQITGALIINAKNVVVRNCAVSSFFAKGEQANGTGVIKILAGATAIIEHCTLDGRLGTHAAIWYEGKKLTARFNSCFNVNDGIFVWDASDFLVEDNFIHGLTEETANGHIDGFQTEGGSRGVIRHNTFDIPTGQNACIAIWNERGNSDDILVENNYMAGGGFTCYAEDYSPSEEHPAGGFSVTNIRFLNNRFSTKYYRCTGYFGVWYPRGKPTDKWIRKGNIVLETGENIDTGNPHSKGKVCE